MTHVNLHARALCELDDVKRYAPGYSGQMNETTEDALVSLINAQTRSFAQRARREFVAVEATQPAIRLFDVTDTDAASRKVWVGDMADTADLAVTVLEQSGDVVEVVDPDAVVGLPRNREEWEPINWLWFPAGADTAAAITSGQVLSVESNWGFPSIPDDVTQAVAKMVIVRYVSDVANAGTGFADALDNIDVGALFASAREVASLYRMPSLH